MSNLDNLNGFDASTVDPSVGFDPVPAGDYPAIMTDSEFKPTKSGDGEYLQCTWEIIDGTFTKRLIFDRLNLKNKNETASKIAMSTLSAICHAVGVLKPKGSVELHGKPCMIKVGVEERNDKPGSYSNKIKGYAAMGVASAAPAVAAATAKPDGDAKPPWKK
jgi:hypothetical protein